MSKQKWAIAVISVLTIIGFWASQKLFKSNNPGSINSTKLEGSIYWTCPMHPQIHQDHAGECPICHMKLVKRQESKLGSMKESEDDKCTDVQITSNQLDLIGVQKTNVEKMNLTAKIFVSGRILSSSGVAFQVYENDLRYIHAGLKFKGESSTNSEEVISGVITSVDSIVDPSSRTVRVLGSITSSAKSRLSETSFSAEIFIELNDRIFIPESSVLHTGHGELIYIFSEENKLTPKNIKLGLKTEGFYEVLSGLAEGATISSGPNFLIDSEAKIRGSSEAPQAGSKASTPECAEGQHWDVPMSMCMPGKSNK